MCFLNMIFLQLFHVVGLSNNTPCLCLPPCCYTVDSEWVKSSLFATKFWTTSAMCNQNGTFLSLVQSPPSSTSCHGARTHTRLASLRISCSLRGSPSSPDRRAVKWMFWWKNTLSSVSCSLQKQFPLSLSSCLFFFFLVFFCFVCVGIFCFPILFITMTHVYMLMKLRFDTPISIYLCN